MKYNKIMFMLVLAIFIFGAASVCASDVSGTVIASEDTGQMELSAGNENEIVERASNEEVIGEGNVGTFQELQENITQGYASGYITLDKDYEYEDLFSTDGITITQGITIDGQGHKIDAKGKARIFNIETDNVILKNITFLNGKSTDGGAINWKANYGSVLDCRFENNTATGNGSAVYFWNSGDVTNCNFAGNTAEYGGSVYFNGTGEVTNCNFTNNQATSDGGAIYFAEDSNGIITNCNFVNNAADGWVGAVCFDGNGDVTNCNFTNNSAYYGGGAVLIYTGTLTNSNFVNNKGTIDHSYAGAVCMYSGTVENCNFINNTATDGDGGAIWICFGTVTNCNFVNNIASNGSAVYFNITGSVDNCNFTNNTATGNGGAIYLAEYSEGNVINCNFINNKATTDDSYGGAVCMYSGTVENCNFVNNTATDGDGGAIWICFGTVTNCNFVNNKATTDDSYGGAVCMYSGSVENCNFTNNNAVDCGGAVFFWNISNLTNCNFTNNTAEYGGSVYFNGTGEVTNCNFAGNTAVYGGAINIGSGNVSNCNFTDNTASGKGGAVYVDKTFSNSKIASLFINNSANNGGAIYFNGGIKNVTINGYFKGNNAERAGGAIFVRGQSRNSTFSSEFYDNRARQASGGGIFFGNLVENNRFESIFKSNFAFYGGGIFLYNKANSNEFSSDFINNTAKSCGGAIFFYNTTDKNNFSGSFINNSALGEVSEIVGNGGAITFKDISSNCMFTCDFINNTAALNGGGINYRQTPHNITLNANFINNTSPRGGGVNFFESFENVIFNGEFICNCANNGGAIAAGEGIIKDVSFSNNHAKTGGAVYFAESGEIINCNFAGNSAELGGSLFMDSGSVINCNFTNNTATKNGGAIFVVNNTNILNSVFDNNNANSSGGAVYIYKAFSNSKINSTFINNSANNGGAIYFNGEIKNTTVNGCFNANIAERAGGAIFIRGQSRNSTFSSEFYDNRARQASGGAIFFYNLAENNRFESIFKSNFAFYGGGIFLYNKANSNEFISDFINNTAKSCGGAMFFHNTTDGNNFTGDFIGNSALGQVDESVGNGGAITFKDTSSNSIFNSDFINNTANLNGGGVNYRHTPYNITFNSNFINNTSPRGGGVNFFETFENVIFNGDFIGNSAVKGGAIAAVDGIIEGVSFTDNLAEKGGAVYINGTGEVINCIFTNNTATSDYDGGGAVYIGSGDVTGSVFTSNGATSLGGTGGAIFIKNSGDVTDCSFEDNFAEFGGAVATEINGNVNNCDFTANRASVEGGALYIGSGNVKNSNFTNNKASNGDGGAVYINGNVTVINCNFTGNEADMGSAIYYWVVGDSKYLRSISHSTFLNNKANMDPTTPFTFTINETNIEIAFEGNDNLLNAILSRRNADVNITNVTYWGANGVENTGDSTIVPVMSYMEAGQNVTIIGVVNGMPVNARGVTNVEGKVVLDAGSGDYWLSVGHDDDSYYSSAKTVFTNMALNANVTSQTTTNKTVNITAKSNIYSEVMPGKLIFILPNNTEINANYGTNGTWWAEHTFDAYGVYKVNASYIGLDNVAVSNGTVTIVRADSAIILDDIVLNYGESINVTVTTEGATGITAKIDENDVDVVNNFTISVSGLGVGNYTLTVTTIADEDHNSVNKTVKITVNKAPANITITNETLDLKVGYNSSISATLTPADAGNVTFTSSNSSVVTVDDKGNVKAVGVGSAIITVSFAGNDNYTAAENKTVEVTVAEYMVVSAPDLTKYYNGPERFVVIVTDSKGNPWVNQSVNITINGVTYSRTTNDNGTASMAIRLVGGQYNVTTIVDNITVYSTVTVLPTVNATDLVKVFRNGTQFYATFKDSNGDYLPEGTMVRFNINGEFYDRKVSGDKGLVKLNINIQQGQYVITSMNRVTGENASNNVTVISRLVENNDLVKYYRNASQYTVKVIGDDGNAVGAGEIVTFNVHGVLYNRTTNESGIAKLNINLGPGDYIITAEHKDCRVSNNIKVLPVLTAKDLSKKYGTPDQFIANLVDGQGNPFAGETVQFNVNGVLYDRVTDSNGQAKLNIRLMPGKYIITSSYNGASISNNITVSA